MNSLQILVLINIFITASALGIHLQKGRMKNRALDRTITGALVYVLSHLTYVLISKLYFSEDNWVEDSAPFGLVYGPLFYFALFSYCNGHLSRIKVVRHCLPYLTFLVIQIYLLLIGLNSGSFTAGVYMRILYTLIPVSFFFYGVLGYRIVKQSGRKLNAFFYLFFVCNLILLLVIAVFFLTASLDMNRPIIDSGVDMGGMMIYSFFAAGMTTLLLFIIQRTSTPGVAGLNPERTAGMDGSGDGVLKSPAAYEKSSLTADVLLNYEQKLDQYMKNREVWKNHDLKLDILADEMKMQRHHITQVLSVQKGKNFNFYVNEMRIRHACRLIEEGKNDDVSLADIGYMSGFNSKSTFYRWFREIKNMTPAQYLEKLHSPQK